MAEDKSEPAPAPAVEGGSGEHHQQKKKTVVMVGVDDSDHSYYALEWAVRHLAAGMAGAADLVIVHAKPKPSSVVSFGGPGAGEAMRYVEADLRKMAEAVVDRARQVCIANSVGARSGRGGRRGAQVRALQRRRQAPRRPARRRQPWLRRHQEGFPGERERLLRAPHALLRHDCQAPQVLQMLNQPSRSKC